MKQQKDNKTNLFKYNCDFINMQTLQKYKLEICKNPEKYENFNIVDKYINNKNLNT
jgi:hypothetical protein